MTLSDKTPMARKAAWSYCRRCLAVMLCCVLAFGFAVPTAPRAKANAAVDAVEIVGAGGGAAGAAALGSNPVGATICGLLLTVVCVDFAVGYLEHDETKYYSDGVYKLGGQCWDYLYNLGGDIAEWCMSRSSSDVLPGSTFEAPPEVLEAVRQWAVSHFDFADGICSYENYALGKDGKYFVLSDVDTAQLDTSTNKYKSYKCSVRNLGNLVPFHAGDFSESYEFRDYITDDIYCVSRYILNEPITDGGTWSASLEQRWYLPGFSNDTSVSAGLGVGMTKYSSLEQIIASAEGDVASQNRFGVLFCSSAGNRLYCGVYDAFDGFVYAYSANYCSLDAIASFETTETTVVETPALNEEKVAVATVTVPASVPTTTVGDLTIPVFGDLTAGDLTGEKEDEYNKPDATGGIPWEQLRELLERLNGKAGDMSQGLDGINDKLGELPGAISDAVSGSMADALADSMAGVIAKADAQQQTVENSLAEPDDLGAVFISKFPFCIPWDVAKAVELLAAPPVTPRWEMDFMQPIGQRIGGFQGDTTLVIDFGEYPIVGIATRWFSTVMFLYALASGTKRLIWTA